MTKISLIDTTVRDGNQSNWGATGLDTGHDAANRPGDGPGGV